MARLSRSAIVWLGRTPELGTLLLNLLGSFAYDRAYDSCLTASKTVDRRRFSRTERPMSIAYPATTVKSAVARVLVGGDFQHVLLTLALAEHNNLPADRIVATESFFLVGDPLV